MQITESKAGAVTVLAMEGRLETGSAPQAEATLLARLDDGSVVADLSALRYVSSAGLRVLLSAAKLAKARQHGFALCALQPPVREVLAISGFDRIIAVHPGRAEALAALG